MHISIVWLTLSLFEKEEENAEDKRNVRWLHYRLKEQP